MLFQYFVTNAWPTATKVILRCSRMKHECEASNFSQLRARLVYFGFLVFFVIGFLLRPRLNVSEPSLDLFCLFFQRLRMRAAICGPARLKWCVNLPSPWLL